MGTEKVKEKKKRIKIGCCTEFANALILDALQIDEDDGALYIKDGDDIAYYCPFCGFKFIYE